jgi:prophage DNA circulation protein
MFARSKEARHDDSTTSNTASHQLPKPESQEALTQLLARRELELAAALQMSEVFSLLMYQTGRALQTKINSDPSQILYQLPYHVATLSPDQPLLSALLTAPNNCS